MLILFPLAFLSNASCRSHTAIRLTTFVKNDPVSLLVSAARASPTTARLPARWAGRC